MKLPCWRCIVVYLVSLPPIAAYLVYRRYAHDEEFRAALKGLEEKIKKIVEEGERLGTIPE